jgi:hypothetical protein
LQAGDAGVQNIRDVFLPVGTWDFRPYILKIQAGEIDIIIIGAPLSPVIHSKVQAPASSLGLSDRERTGHLLVK